MVGNTIGVAIIKVEKRVKSVLIDPLMGYATVITTVTLRRLYKYMLCCCT